MKISVIGGGSWGLSLAQVLLDNNHFPAIYNRDIQAASNFNKTHKTPLLLVDCEFDHRLHIETSLSDVCKNVDVIVLAVPTNAVRPVLLELMPYITPDVIIVNAAKGIEQNTHYLISEVVNEVLGEQYKNNFVALSGPSHAEEVAARQLTTVVAASNNQENAKVIQDLFTNDTYFRVYTSSDLIGAELGGALKNIIAVASGYLSGKGYGDNTKAALLTRGIAEMVRLGTKLGGDPMTFAGLTGIGDLIVTATSKHSRNYQAGFAIANGTSIDEILNSNKTVEGILTAKSTYELSQKLNVEMPITEFIYNVITKNHEAEDFAKVLFAREKKSEEE